MINVYQMLKNLFHSINELDRITGETHGKEWTKQQPGVDPMNYACEVYSTPFE